MPAYEYRCAKCGLHLEEERTLEQGAEPSNCIACDSPLIRLYNFGSVTFKGSGFYKTDK